MFFDRVKMFARTSLAVDSGNKVCTGICGYWITSVVDDILWPPTEATARTCPIASADGGVIVKLAVVCSSIEDSSKCRVAGSTCQPVGKSKFKSPDAFAMFALIRT